MAQQPQQQGLNSSDFRENFQRRAAVATLTKKNGAGVNGDRDFMAPVREGLALRAQVLGQKVVDQTINEVDADSLKAQNELLKAKIEHRQLEEVAKGAAQQGNSEWMAYILKQLDATQDRLQVTQEALSAQQLNALGQRLELLTGELERVRAERAEPAQPQSPLSLVKSVLQDYQDLQAVLAPPPPPEPVAPPRTDPALQAWIIKDERSHQRWLIEREDAHKERLEELRLAHEARMHELSVKREHDDKMDRFLSDTAPKVVGILEKLAQRVLIPAPDAGVVAPAVGSDAAPVAASVSEAPAPPVELPAGTQVMACMQCGANIVYRPEWPGVFCPSCHAEYGNNGPSEDEPVAADMVASAVPAATRKALVLE